MSVKRKKQVSKEIIKIVTNPNLKYFSELEGLIPEDLTIIHINKMRSRRKIKNITNGRRNKISLEILEKILDPNIKNFHEISSFLDEDYTVNEVNNIRARRGLHRIYGETRYLTEEEKDLACSDLENTEDIKALFNDIVPSTQSINTHRAKRGLKPIKSNKFSRYNDDYFQIPNLKNSYWAGFICADGNISQTRDSLNINLDGKDWSHLRKLADELGCNNVGYNKDPRYQNTYIARLSAYSGKICEDLERNFNIVPAKSLIAKPPVGLSKEQELAFIAGYQDGDGSYSFSGTRPTLMSIGTKEILEWILGRLGFSETQLYLNNKNQDLTFVFRIGGNKAIYARSRYIDLDVPFLERKYRRWEKLGLDMEIKKNSQSYNE